MDAAEFDAQLAQLSEQLIVTARRLLSPQLQARVGGSDVGQEVLAEAVRRRDAYLNCPALPLDIWLTRLLRSRLVDLYRHHIDAQRRSLHKETRLSVWRSQIVAQIALTEQDVVQKISQQEQEAVVEIALSSLAATDRQILIWRHEDDLSNAEVAELLEISPDAAKKRHGRALLKLRRQLKSLGVNSSHAQRI